MLPRFNVVATVSAVLLLALSGCGGSGGPGSSSTATGGFKLKIQWPTTRTIPTLSDRLELSVKSDDGVVNVTKSVTRGTDAVSTVEFTGLPAKKSLSFSCRAFNGQSTTALGTAASNVTLVQGVDNVVVLDLQSTIDHLKLGVKNSTATSLSIFQTETGKVTVEAFNADNELVLVSPSNLTFTAPSQATVTSDMALPEATVTGVTVGTGNLTVREQESGKSATVSVRVRGISRIAIDSGSSVELIRGQTLALHATAYDDDDQIVTDTFTFTALYPEGQTVHPFHVSTDGKSLIGDAPGSASVVVTESRAGVSATFPVSVLAHGLAKTARLDLDPNHAKIVRPNPADPNDTGDPAMVIATAKDEFGNNVPLDDQIVMWSLDTGLDSNFRVDPSTSTPAKARVRCTNKQPTFIFLAPVTVLAKITVSQSDQNATFDLSIDVPYQN